MKMALFLQEFEDRFAWKNVKEVETEQGYYDLEEIDHKLLMMSIDIRNKSEEVSLLQAMEALGKVKKVLLGYLEILEKGKKQCNRWIPPEVMHSRLSGTFTVSDARSCARSVIDEIKRPVVQGYQLWMTRKGRKAQALVRGSNDCMAAFNMFVSTYDEYHDAIENACVIV